MTAAPIEPITPSQKLEYILKRWPQNDSELWEFVKTVWGISLPRQRICPDHQAPFEAFADAFFARSYVSVWKASRGFGGKTTMLALLGLMEAMIWETYVVILGGSAAQSLRVHEEMQLRWDTDRAPVGLLRHETRFDTYLHTGGHIRALMASSKSVRGPHPTRLRLDEIDEMDVDILDAAMGQPMEQQGIMPHTVMSSTHQYPDKTMTEILKRAKEKSWPVFQWCYKETSNPIDGWLTQRAVLRKRQEVTQHMWQTEYDLQEPSFEGRAINTEAVDWMFSQLPGSFAGAEGEYIEIEAPTRDGEYATGTDWAKSQDWTIISTYRTDCAPWRLVAWERLGRRPWPAMVRRLDQRLSRYGGLSAHDATGLGSVVADHLVHDVEPVTFTGRNKADFLSDYVAAIEGKKLAAPRIEFAHGEHRYATNDDLYGSGHPPDSLVSGALCWHLRKDKIAMIPPASMTKLSHWGMQISNDYQEQYCPHDTDWETCPLCQQSRSVWTGAG